MACWFAAAGQDFIVVNKGEGICSVFHFAFQQGGAAGTTKSLAAMVLHVNLLRFKAFQQRFIGRSGHRYRIDNVDTVGVVAVGHCRLFRVRNRQSRLR